MLSLLLMAALCVAQQKKELRYSVQAGAILAVTNDTGSIMVRPASGNQIIVSAAPMSTKVEVDGAQAGNRVDIRSHALQKTTGDEGRVDYYVQVPSGTAIILHNGNGALRVQNASGDVSIDANGGSVEVSESSSVNVRVRTMGASVIVSGVRKAHVEVSSVSGELTLHNVSGPQVTAETTGGPIHFIGDCAGGGDYSLSSHTGNIEVILPANASVDVSARSVNGTVEDGFQLQPDSHPTMPITAGKSFAGRANSGAASLRARTFSGKITVKKQ